MGDTLRALEAAYAHAVDWVESVPNRPVAAAATAEQLLTLLDGPLPVEPTDPAEVINMLAATAEKGLVATPSGRFFGFVVGGALPTALAADWLTSAWEPNAAFAALAPTEAAVEAVAARWVTDCLGLPADASVGFTTGAAMANFTCLAAARHRVLEQTGWDVEARGLQGAPMVTVLSEDRHVSVDAVLRYLGFGSDGVVPIATDNEGRIRPTALADNLRKVTGPSIVCLQAANVNSGSCDPFPRGDRGRQGTLGLGACRRGVWAVGRRKPDHPTPRRRCGRGQLVGHRRHKWRRRVVRRATPGRERPPREAKAPSRGLLLGGVQQRVHADTADMSGCCDSRGCNDMFGPRFARHLASRYRKRGLDKTAARMVAYLVDRGLDGASVLEIGGGVGDIQLELLGQGASRTTNLELVDAYDADATDLAKSAGLRDRMTRLRVDIAATPDEVETHDVVVLHRVVCCYPDYERLLTAAADHAKRLLVFSHPRRNWVSWTFTHLQNVSFRLVGKSFRTFAHPPAAMVAVAEVRGMHTEYSYRGPVWQVVGLARATTAGR